MVEGDKSPHIPKLKPIGRADFCGHAQKGAPIAAAITLQPAEDQDFRSAATLLCARCALACGEAVVAALRAEWAIDKGPPR